MNIRLLIAGASLSACAVAQAAQAQTNPPATTKYNMTSRPVIIYSGLPAACDDPVGRAASTWNAAGANFVFTDAGVRWSQSAYNDGTGINIISAVLDGYGANVTTATTIYSMASATIIADSDVKVNNDLIYYPQTTDVKRPYDFWCNEIIQGPIGSMADYESTILHELGHAVGFGHRTDGTTGPCVMAAAMARGTLKRSLCTDEAQKLRSVYGVR